MDIILYHIFQERAMFECLVSVLCAACVLCTNLGSTLYRYHVNDQIDSEEFGAGPTGPIRPAELNPPPESQLPSCLL